MESSYISILESFPLISVIMPFYGSTDEMFLVLSSLWVRTRRILIEYYPEFRRFMLDYSKVKKLSIKELLEIDLPLDLFVLYINELSLNKGVEDLIALINTLN